MNYVEVYSVGYIKGSLYFLMFVVLIIALILIVRYVNNRKWTDEKAYKILTLYGVIIVAGLLVLGLSYINLRQYYILVSKDYKIVEGTVTNFIPQSLIGEKRREQFIVNGVKFEYSSAEITGAYNKPRSDGGYLSEGEKVKLFYHDNDILKVYVEK